MQLLAGESFKVPKANGDNRPDDSLTYRLPQHPMGTDAMTVARFTEFSTVCLWRTASTHRKNLVRSPSWEQSLP